MDWKAECQRVHDEGLANLIRDGRIPFRLRPYQPSGRHPEDLLLGDGLSDCSRMLLQTVTVDLLRKFKVAAAFIQSDSMTVNSTAFAEHFRLPETMAFEKYQEEYLRILNKDFGGTMANLPRHLWSGAIITGLKGPKIETICVCNPYRKDDSGKIMIDPPHSYSMGFIDVLPDWWEPVKN